jgi:hypothetical protein
MSDFRAIAGVSNSLQALLRDRMDIPQGLALADLNVTISSPKTDEDAALEDPRINLFLYRVTENGSLKNQEIPGQGHPSAYGQPPLSLNLHYLLTTYGTTTQVGATVNETRAQQLLGSAMRVLHEIPTITNTLLTLRAPAGQNILDVSLRNQFERIKVSLESLSLEELSKIWTALNLPFRLGASYMVTVIQIEPKTVERMPLPVKRRQIQVAVLERPMIDQVYRTPLPGEIIGDPRAAVGQQLTIEGSNLRAAKTLVKLGPLAPIVIANPLDDLLSVTIPDDVLLQPGAQTVQVITEHPSEMVAGGLDHGTLVPVTGRQASSQSVFLLVPSITTVLPASGAPGTVITVTGTRLFRDDLASFISIGDVAVQVRRPQPGDPFAAPTPTSVQIVVPALPVSATPYPVRATVNGAQSIEEGTFLVT